MLPDWLSALLCIAGAVGILVAIIGAILIYSDHYDDRWRG